MKVKDIMTNGPACCGPETRLDKVAHLMAENDCGALPIVDGTRLIGIVTDRDIALRGFGRSRNPLDVPVKNIMTIDVLAVDEETDADAALRLMGERRVRRVPVMRQNKVVGIVAQADLAEHLPAEEVAQFLDAVSRRAVLVR